MNPSPDLPSRPAGSSRTPAQPGRLAIVGRSLIALIGIMVCTYAAALPYLIPSYRDWLMAAESRGAIEPVLVAETLRFPLAAVAALGLLALAARVEKVRLGDYFGWLSPRRHLGTLALTALAAAAVTAAAGGLSHLTGLDAGRAGPGGPETLPLVLGLLYGLSRAFLLQGVQEEWWFRGFAFRGLSRHPWFVLGATTLVSTATHLVSSGGQQSTAERLIYLALPFGMGLWAGVERWVTGSVWGAVGIHGGIHTGLMVPAAFGWEMGPTMWLIGGAALSVAALARLLTARPWLRSPQPRGPVAR